MLIPDFLGLDDPGPDTHGSPDEAARLHHADDSKKEEAPGEEGDFGEIGDVHGRSNSCRGRSQTDGGKAARDLTAAREGRRADQGGEGGFPVGGTGGAFEGEALEGDDGALGRGVDGFPRAEADGEAGGGGTGFGTGDPLPVGTLELDAADFPAGLEADGVVVGIAEHVEGVFDGGRRPEGAGAHLHHAGAVDFGSEDIGNLGGNGVDAIAPALALSGGKAVSEGAGVEVGIASFDAEKRAPGGGVRSFRGFIGPRREVRGRDSGGFRISGGGGREERGGSFGTRVDFDKTRRGGFVGSGEQVRDGIRGVGSRRGKSRQEGVFGKWEEVVWDGIRSVDREKVVGSPGSGFSRREDRGGAGDSGFFREGKVGDGHVNRGWAAREPCRTRNGGRSSGGDGQRGQLKHGAGQVLGEAPPGNPGGQQRQAENEDQRRLHKERGSLIAGGADGQLKIGRTCRGCAST